MADDDEPVDDDAVAAEWEAMAGGDDGDQEEMAAEWEAMAGGDEEEEAEDAGGPSPGRVLDQDEIDSLLGFDGDGDGGEMTGIHALINTALVSYERLPMLDIIFDRMVRMMSTSLRNFT